jgi:hypothetical protein
MIAYSESEYWYSMLGSSSNLLLTCMELNDFLLRVRVLILNVVSSSFLLLRTCMELDDCLLRVRVRILNVGKLLVFITCMELWVRVLILNAGKFLEFITYMPWTLSQSLDTKCCKVLMLITYMHGTRWLLSLSQSLGTQCWGAPRARWLRHTPGISESVSITMIQQNKPSVWPDEKLAWFDFSKFSLVNWLLVTIIKDYLNFIGLLSAGHVARPRGVHVTTTWTPRGHHMEPLTVATLSQTFRKISGLFQRKLLFTITIFGTMYWI